MADLNWVPYVQRSFESGLLAEFDCRNVSQSGGFLSAEFLGDASRTPRGIYRVTVPVARQVGDDVWERFATPDSLLPEDSYATSAEKLAEWSQAGIETQIGLSYWTGEAAFLGDEAQSNEG